MSIDYAVGQRLTAELLQQLADYTVNRPITRLIAIATLALADNTEVAIQFGVGSTVFDTHDFHSETVTNTRVTPTVAGIYVVTGVAFFEAQTTPVISNAWIRENGTTRHAAAGRYPGATQAFSLMTQVEIDFNGTTDYVELCAQQDSAGADNTNQSIQFSSTLSVKFDRPA